MKAPSLIAIALLAVVASIVVQPAALAQDDGPDLGWSDSAELSFVLTAGNSDTQTLGLKNTTERKWERALLKISLGALKAESTTELGFAVGTPGDYTVPDVTATTAENYFLTARYDRNISKKFFWYVAAGWLRNEFAGIRDRYTGTAGLGNLWVDRERFMFRTNYGLSYTDQTDVVEVPGADRSYPGALVGWNLKKGFGKGAEYGNDFVYNYSFDESDEWRWVMDQWIGVSLTEKLALKVSLAWLYNNLPAVRELELRPTADAPPTGTVVDQLDELDTVFNASLVVNF